MEFLYDCEVFGWGLDEKNQFSSWREVWVW